MNLRAEVAYWKHRAEVAEAKAATMRSPQWPAVRKAHLKKESECQYCGGILNLEVHHILPFSTHHSMELEPTNLITLCEAHDKNCHLKCGHLGSWGSINPNVRSDCNKHKKE